MRYGYFDDDRREYVITRPDTPVPWINYLGTDEHFGTVSNTAGGFSWHLDARLRRLTRYRYNNVPGDTGGRYLYLRDDATGEFWSPSWQPTRTPLDEYECRHGLSYTTIRSARAGIAAQTLYFVPRGENLEVWRAAITNDRTTAAQLSLFSSAEFALWDAQDDMTNFQRNYSTGEVEVADGVIYHKTEYRERRDHFAYFACSEPLAGFETQREAFLGPYRGFHEPVGVERGKLSDSIAHGWSPHGAHHVTLTLEPGETKEVIFLLGYWENPRDAKFESLGVINKSLVRPVIKHWLDPQTVREGFADLGAYWDNMLGVLVADTPDTDSNRMVSIWNAYQCLVTFNMSRSVSSYETGISRGMGFRDSCQDLLGAVQLVPERSRERILDIAATQFASGGAYHQYQPLTKTGNDAIGSGFNDDPLWLVLAVAAYLKETGDTTILDEPVKFSDGGGATLYGHLERSVQYTLDRIGPHGLPLIGRADWNDCLNLNCFSETPGESFQTTENQSGGVAESVFIAGLFTLAGRHRRAHRPRRGGGGLPGRRGEDGRRDRRARLGRRVVPAGLRLLRQPGRHREEPRGPDLHRAAGHVHHGRDRAAGSPGGLGRPGPGLPRRAGPGEREGAARHPARGHAAPARVHHLPHGTRRDLLLPAGLQGERERLLPHEPVGHDRLGDDRRR
jgi:cellobiose phosphorylase